MKEIILKDEVTTSPNCAFILAHWVLKRQFVLTYLFGVLAFQRLSATTSCHRGTSRQTGKLFFTTFPSPCLKELCVTKSIEIQGAVCNEICPNSKELCNEMDGEGLN